MYADLNTLPLLNHVLNNVVCKFFNYLLVTYEITHKIYGEFEV
jgi:hypothetical protein